MECKEKVRYKSKQAAEKVKKYSFFKGRKRRVYFCNQCFFYHLTTS